MNSSNIMNLTMSKLFSTSLQQEDAEFIIQLLAHQKNDQAQRIAADLDERYRWNYRSSAIK